MTPHVKQVGGPGPSEQPSGAGWEGRRLVTPSPSLLFVLLWAPEEAESPTSLCLPAPPTPFPGTPRLATHSQQYAGTIPPFRRTGWNWVSKFSFSHLTPNPHCLQQLCSPAAGRMLSPLQASLKPGRLPHNPALTSHVEAGHPWKGLPTSAVPSGLGRSEENPEPARNSGFATLRHDSSETENEGSILCILLVLCPPSRKSRS